MALHYRSVEDATFVEVAEPCQQGDGFVRFCPVGGGFVGKLANDEFNKRFVADDKGWAESCQRWKMGLFSVGDNSKVYIGYDTPARWNGWRMPSFDWATCRQIASDLCNGSKPRITCRRADNGVYHETFYAEDYAFKFVHGYEGYMVDAWKDGDTMVWSDPIEGKVIATADDMDSTKLCWSMGDGFCWDGWEDETEAIARRFGAIICEWLGSEKLRQAIEANANESDPLVCHTHSYCDANMAMLEAFEGSPWSDSSVSADDVERLLNGGSPSVVMERHHVVWGWCWDMARANEFYRRENFPNG